MQTLPRWLGAFALLLVSGCTGSQYVFQPVADANAMVRGHVAADYAVPANDPKGDVRVASLGLLPIRVPADSPARKALALRVVVSNNTGAGPWQLDTRVQQLFLPGQAPEAPDLVVSKPAEAGPILFVLPASQKTFDLYFALPAGYDTSGTIPAFDLFWQIDTPEGHVAERTPFERFQVEPVPDVYATGPLSGPFTSYAYWWADPYWPPIGLRSYYYNPPYNGYPPYTGRPHLQFHGGGPRP